MKNSPVDRLNLILGTQPRAVGKRTPRFPISYSHKKDDSKFYVSPNKRGWKSDIDDDEVAHVAALALTEASQRGGSPQISQTPYRRTEHTKSSPVQSWERMVFCFSPELGKNCISFTCPVITFFLPFIITNMNNFLILIL